MAEQTRKERFAAGFMKLDEWGKSRIEEGLADSSGVRPLVEPKLDSCVMPEAGGIIAGYLEGGRIITVSFLDFHESSEEQENLVQEMNSQYSDVMYSLSDTGIRFQCNDETLEMDLSGEIYIKDNPFEDDYFAEPGESEPEPASGVKSLYIIAREQKNGVGIVYYKEQS
jgi:hypothetical protein